MIGLILSSSRSCDIAHQILRPELQNATFVLHSVRLDDRSEIFFCRGECDNMESAEIMFQAS